MKNKKIKISIIEDSEIHREWLKIELAEDERIEVVSVNSLGRKGVESVKLHHPHLVILDFQMEDMTGLEASKRIKAYNPDIKIFVHTAHTEISIVERILSDENVDAIAIKGSDFFAENFLLAIHNVVAGGTYLDPSLLKKLRETKKLKGLSELTKREFEIFIQVNLGKSDAKIAEDLFVEAAHVKNIKSKIAKKIQNDDIHGLLTKLIANAQPDSKILEQ